MYKRCDNLISVRLFVILRVGMTKAKTCVTDSSFNLWQKHSRMSSLPFHVSFFYIEKGKLSGVCPPFTSLGETCKKKGASSDTWGSIKNNFMKKI